MIRYCTRCVMPETKPDILFDDEGVCSACRHFAARTEVDWDARAAELEDILGRYRNDDGSNYDCIVPVSGGKDSTFQILRVLQLGLNSARGDLHDVLAHRHRPPEPRQPPPPGADSVEVTPNPKIR
ncbi:MAG: hypothetical protein R2711_12550 [Acidimicrobiales bacterium]